MEKTDKMQVNRIYKNGKICTENNDAMWAEAIAVSGKTIQKVGTNAECLALAGSETQIIDLQGNTVIPGLLDGHTHPNIVASTVWHVRMPKSHDKETFYNTIRKYAAKYPKEEVPYFYGESYYADTFGAEGPKKEELDELIPDRPARIQDFTDHACWYNTMALEMLGILDGTGSIPGPAGEADIIRDENGEPTGWVLEAAPDMDYGCYEKTGYTPPTGIEEESVGPFLDFLKSKGITGLMDGFTVDEAAIATYYEMDKAGRLNMYYQGASLMTDDLEEAIANLRDWQEKYTSEHVSVNVIKLFMDGTNEMGNSASLEPMRDDPTGEYYGDANYTEEQLTGIMVRLNEENIDMHIHMVCDRAFRMCCNAVEQARAICGESWRIYVTFAHCELIHPDDKKRVAELGIFIDWSTHWAGGYFGTQAIDYLGRERWDTMYDFTQIIGDGGIVGFSSDLFSYQEANRGDPYFGMQTTMTRVDPELPLDPTICPGSVRPPESAKLPIETLLRGYTYNNALRMRLLDRVGTIEAGKLANFVVLNKDIFTLPAEEVHTVQPVQILFEGEEQEILDVRF